MRACVVVLSLGDPDAVMLSPEAVKEVLGDLVALVMIWDSDVSVRLADVAIVLKPLVVATSDLLNTHCVPWHSYVGGQQP